MAAECFDCGAAFVLDIFDILFLLPPCPVCGGVLRDRFDEEEVVSGRFLVPVSDDEEEEDDEYDNRVVADPLRTGCALCGVARFSSGVEMESHFSGRRHQSNMDEQRERDLLAAGCDICGVARFGSHVDRSNHLSGRRHRENLERDRSDDDDVGSPEDGCALCGVARFGSRVEMESHFSGRRHQSNMDEQRERDLLAAGCDICGVARFGSHVDRSNHLSGRRHRENLERDRSDEDADEDDDEYDDQLNFAQGCRVCGINTFTSATDMMQHLNGRRHLMNKAADDEEQGAKRQAQVRDINNAFDDLDRLNSWLVKLGDSPQPSKTKARELLKTFHINIFDLQEGNFRRVFHSVRELRQYSVSNDKVFPLEQAKTEGLRVFLKNFF